MTLVSSGFSLTERHAIETENDQILYQIYGQDGEFVSMRCADTPSNRMFVLWLRQHDRFSGKRISHRGEKR